MTLMITDLKSRKNKYKNHVFSYAMSFFRLRRSAVVEPTLPTSSMSWSLYHNDN